MECMMSLSDQFNDLHLAVSEVDVLATIVAEWFDGQDWTGADPVIVEHVGLILGVLARAATMAGSKLDDFEAVLTDAQSVPPGQWDFPEETSEGARSISASEPPY